MNTGKKTPGGAGTHTRRLMSRLVRVMQAWERCAGSHMPQALIHPGRTGMYRVLIYHLIHHSRMHHSCMRPSISRPKFISFWTSASRPISTFSSALSACWAHRPPRLGHERTADGLFSSEASGQQTGRNSSRRRCSVDPTCTPRVQPGRHGRVQNQAAGGDRACARATLLPHPRRGISTHVEIQANFDQRRWRSRLSL